MLYLQADKEDEVVKYQWSIHHNRESKWKGNLLSLNSAGEFCHKALNYSSILKWIYYKEDSLAIFILESYSHL